MAILHNLELHVAHACNLACESCSHYSNQRHKGLLSLDRADQWMSLWSKRVRPQRFTLLGGEPTLHPRLADFLTLVRSHWPKSQLKITTNGFFLDRHPELPQRLQETRCELCISVHHSGEEYAGRLSSIRATVETWQAKSTFRVTWLDSYSRWTRRYRGEGSSIMPYDDNNARQSWEICPGKFCRQLYEGHLWKCAPLAYLRMQHARYGLGDAWLSYLNYRPLEASCTPEELEEFLQQQDEPYCQMCPSYPRPFAKPNPIHPDSSAKVDDSPNTDQRG